MAVVREEEGNGPLAEALRRRGLVPAACPVLVEGLPTDPRLLAGAAARLLEYDWVICASARAVDALGRVIRGPWPEGTRVAAVGPATASALVRLGVAQAPFVASHAGAEGLWDALRSHQAWPGQRVLVLTTPGGRTALADGLRDAGARVEEVEAYRMEPRPAAEIRDAWAAAAPDALAIGSPRAVTTLVNAVGVDAVARLSALAAIGQTTGRALVELGLIAHVAPDASFESVADTLARLHAAAGGTSAPEPTVSGGGRP